MGQSKAHILNQLIPFMAGMCAHLTWPNCLLQVWLVWTVLLPSWAEPLLHQLWFSNLIYHLLTSIGLDRSPNAPNFVTFVIDHPGEVRLAVSSLHVLLTSSTKVWLDETSILIIINQYFKIPKGTTLMSNWQTCELNSALCALWLQNI